MRFTPQFLDEIKARLPVSDVVRARVKLTKSGREWKGLSPFGSEKTPSFFVNDQKAAWFDFSSGKNGDIFSFVMETEGLSFGDAVERLAGEAGVPLPVATQENYEQDKKRAGLHEVLELSAQFFEAQLQQKAGARARGYLSDRGLTPAVQQEFRLGYSPNERYALRDWLAAKNASAETMIEAGMLIHGEDIAVPYDRFRDRVMFPICDRRGRVIAFGGRALDKDVPAKYLNSPETPLFHKGACLYNQHKARVAAHDKGMVIAVEGYVDVISMSVAGFPHTVAPLGTALTPEQCDLLWQMAEEPILCFDGDKAGRKAAYRAIDTALPLIGPGKALRFALLPDGQDPDDLARSGGESAIAEVIGAALPMSDLLFAREVEAAEPLNTPERRAGLERRIGELLKAISDETLRGYYRDDMKARLDALTGRSAGQRGNARAGAGRQQGARGYAAGQRSRFGPQGPQLGYVSAPLAQSADLAQSPVVQRGAALPAREALILAILINHPGLLAQHGEEIGGMDLASREAQRLRDAMLHLAAASARSPADMALGLDAAALGAIRTRIVRSAAGAGLAWCVHPGAAEIDAGNVLAQALALHRRGHHLNKELILAEAVAIADGTEQTFAHLHEIKAELASLEGKEATLEGFGLMSGLKPPPV